MEINWGVYAYRSVLPEKGGQSVKRGGCAHFMPPPRHRENAVLMALRGLVHTFPNTWLVVLTNERFFFLDAAMLTNSVDTQSIRLNRVQAVSASQGLVLGKVMIVLGSRLVTIYNCMKE